MQPEFRGLQIAIVYDDADLIEVRVQASNGRFGGDVRAYAALDAIAKLADALEGFPASVSDAREILLGGFGPELAGGAVALRFSCTDRAGHVAVDVQMESEHPSRPEAARFSIAFEPAGLDRFVRQLRALAPRAGCARLPAA